MSSLTKKIVGYKSFGSKVDVTDPCYDKDVWCRINGIDIERGDYTCIAWIDNDTERVMICGVYLAGIPDANSYEHIGHVGVDAGLCGIFENKPDYTDKAWLDFCEEYKDDKWAITDEGFFTSSGWGDGEYEVVGHKATPDTYDSIEIIF